MPIHFSHEQYETLRQTYRKWWAGELDRPIVPIITYGHPSEIEPSKGPHIAFPTAWDFSIDPRQFVESHHAGLTTHRWHGDAFPYFPTTAFGPGALAAFLGCTPIGAQSTVWFKPPREDIPIEELHFEFDENNPNYRRVLNLYEAAMEKWHGSVVVGMVDMGGVMDVLQSFRGAENLLMDLYDSPDEVLRCIRELQDMWFLYYNKFNEIMAPEAEGYTDIRSLHSGIIRKTPVGDMLEIAYAFSFQQESGKTTDVAVLYYDCYYKDIEYIFELTALNGDYIAAQQLLDAMVQTLNITYRRYRII